MRYDSRRILTVREMRRGDKLHGGITAGKCVTWEVLEIFPQKALLRCGESRAMVTGHDLRENWWYVSTNCPMCELNYKVEPNPLPQFHAHSLGEIEGADVESSFRFRAAQFTRRNKAE